MKLEKTDYTLEYSEQMNKPIIYVASPYTKGDPAINTHFQCKIFNQLMDDGKVWPVVPLWTHFQHTVFPRPYTDWIEYDKAMLPRYDGCLRLNAELPELDYLETESSGADGEVAYYESAGKPVFYSIDKLYEWVDSDSHSRPQQDTPTTRTAGTSQIRKSADARASCMILGKWYF